MYITSVVTLVNLNVQMSACFKYGIVSSEEPQAYHTIEFHQEHPATAALVDSYPHRLATCSPQK